MTAGGRVDEVGLCDKYENQGGHVGRYKEWKGMHERGIRNEGGPCFHIEVERLIYAETVECRQVASYRY